jgi:hypothetical protein
MAKKALFNNAAMIKLVQLHCQANATHFADRGWPTPSPCNALMEPRRQRLTPPETTRFQIESEPGVVIPAQAESNPVKACAPCWQPPTSPPTPLPKGRGVADASSESIEFDVNQKLLQFVA